MRLLARFLRRLGSACYSLACRLDPPAPLVATEPEAPSELEHAVALSEMMARVRERVLREHAEQAAARAQCVDLGAEREARASTHRRDGEVITCTRGQLRRATNAVVAAAVEREIARRFPLRLITSEKEKNTQ